MQEKISFEVFCDQWLEDIRKSGTPTDQERRFAQKIFAQWRNLSELGDDLIMDSHDGAQVDLAYFEPSDPNANVISGDTWYIVFAQFRALDGGASLADRAIPLVTQLASPNGRLSSSTLLPKLRSFLEQSPMTEQPDRLVFVVATPNPPDDALKSEIEKIRLAGREKLGSIFDVTSISIETIYLNTLDDTTAADIVGVRVPIRANVKSSGDHLLIGSVTLPDLYDFLNAYRDQTEDLDQLYEKNVRQFLGGRRRVNKGIQKTLLETPDQFGLYNNGITIVVSKFVDKGNGAYELHQPYIVNGCQTTRSIWDIFRLQKETNIKKYPDEVAGWEKEVAKGIVVVKIVQVGVDNEDLLENITRYTNSQNAVSEKDFVTLDEGFRRWKREMEEKYNVFLEIQRGGWDARQALQIQNPHVRQFAKYANAFDLLKVYGSGWLREAGTAFGRNAAFVPGGTLYRQIVEREGEPFGVHDLYAAFRLQESADRLGFGRGSRKTSRRQTRYLFYLVATDLLRDVMIRSSLPTTASSITDAFLRLFSAGHEDAARELIDAAVGVIDEYLTQGEEDSVFTDPTFKDKFNLDLNGFLKWEGLAKGDNTPSFNNIMAINKRTMGRGQLSPREIIAQAIG